MTPMDRRDASKDAWLDQETCYAQLKAEFDLRFQDPAVKRVCHGGKRLVEHVSIMGLPRLGGSSHASIGHDQIFLAGAVGMQLPPEGEADAKVGLVPGGVEAEAYRCCQILEQVLCGCGARWADLVSLSAQLPSLTDAKVEALERAVDHFSRERGCPSVARTVIGCARLRMYAAVQLEGIALAPPREPVETAAPVVLSRNPSPCLLPRCASCGTRLFATSGPGLPKVGYRRRL